MTEKQKWITRINELTDEIGIMGVSLNALREGDFKVGYYYNAETENYDVYQNEERGDRWIRKSTPDEVEALKKVYAIVSALAETSRWELRQKYGIKGSAENLQAKLKVMTEKQRWIAKINELTDEIGIMDVSLNALQEADFIVGYYYNTETGNYDVYKNEERGDRYIYKNTPDEVEALKEVYSIVYFESDTTRREIRKKIWH